MGFQQSFQLNIAACKARRQWPAVYTLMVFSLRFVGFQFLTLQLGMLHLLLSELGSGVCEAFWPQHTGNPLHERGDTVSSVSLSVRGLLTALCQVARDGDAIHNNRRA